jgi:hypothetical protein
MHELNLHLAFPSRLHQGPLQDEVNARWCGVLQSDLGKETGAAQHIEDAQV